MSSNFDFLSNTFPELSKFGMQAESYLYTDPISSLIKMRMIEETIVNMMLEFDSIVLPYQTDAASKISELYREDLITPDIREILHTLRKAGNQAIHTNTGDTEKAKTLIPMAHSLCEFFYMTYGDWKYVPGKYVMPEEAKAVNVPVLPAEDREKEEEADNLMVAAAVENAAKAPKISKAERKKQAHRAANQRPRTEAETRILIDQQLNKVGWEADTVNLRYSKGSRPQKGHNMAIAEWPTDSVVGNRGYADYALFIGLHLVGIIEAKAIHKDIIYNNIFSFQCTLMGNRD